MVKACLENNRQAQQALYLRFGAMMKGVCLRYAGSEAEAEDILQDAFVHAFRKLEAYNGKGALGGWLRRLTINKALEQYRKNRSVRNTREGYAKEVDDTVTDSIFDQLGLEDLLHKIQKLPAGYRTIFNLYAVEGYTHREIAEKLGIAEGTSKSQFSRSRQMLIEMIKTEQENEALRLAYAKR